MTELLQCRKTNIKSNLLEALIINKRRTEKYQNINPIIHGGHGVDHQARQILSWLFRYSFGIVRLPGTYDQNLKEKYFIDLDIDEIDEAADDIRRIHEFSQHEMKKAVPKVHTINLVRGIGGIEASAVKALLDEIDDSEIPYYFQTFSFFNHVKGAYSRNIRFNFDCPISWIWASGYTLEDIYHRVDEEFIVVSKETDGKTFVNKNNFKITPNVHDIEPVSIDNFRFNDRKNVDKLARIISILTQDGFEPDDSGRYQVCYKPGVWESRISRFGRHLDRLFSSKYSQLEISINRKWN